jgi:peptidyl-prolyl cis-trans isomerase SurA
MKIFRLSIIVLILLSLLSHNELASQDKKKQKSTKNESTTKNGTKSIDQTVIVKIGKETITYAELEKAFKKNLSKKDYSLAKLPKDSLMEFIDLYSKYRLKVVDALVKGYDKDSAVKAEIIQNRRMLAESYFYDKKLIEPNVEEMLNKRDRELQIAIIVKTFAQDPSKGTDSLQTYKRAKLILEKALAGGDFAVLARDSSDDKETAKNGGLVANFITSGNTTRPIDTVIYKLKSGTVYHDLVKIRDGYLIIKCLKNEPRQFVKLRQILLSEGIAKDSLGVIKKADSLIALLKKGADFKRLAEENSNDPASSIRGGDLGKWYSRSTGFEGNGSKLLPQFEAAAFVLKDGEISGKVITEYGIHIIRKDSTRSFNKELERDELKKLYRRVYFESDKREYLASVKKNLGFTFNEIALNKLIASIDTTKTTLQPEWEKNINSSLKTETLFTINKQNTTVGDFLHKISTQKEFKGSATTRDNFRNVINRFADPIAFDYASENLDQEYPDFASLMKEFRDGILLFKVEAIEVWDKLKFDSTQARAFWEQNKIRYNTYPIYDFSEVYVLSDTLAKDIYKFVKSGTDIGTLAEQYTQRQGYREKKGNWGKSSTKDNKLAQLFATKNPKQGDVLEPIPYEQGFSVVYINSVESARMKKFEEAIPDFAPEYQEKVQKGLTEIWMTQLKKKHGLQILEKDLERVIKEINSK